MVEGVTGGPEIPNKEEWAGHWIFNMNESNAPGAYKKMFEKSYSNLGYENSPKTLEGSNPGDIVLAYVNKQRVRALGRIVDREVREGKGIFVDSNGKQRPDE